MHQTDSISLSQFWLSQNILTDLYSDKPIFWAGLTGIHSDKPVFPDHCWRLGFLNGLTATPGPRQSESKRLIFCPNVAVFIPEACFRFCHHLFISGVLIGCFLLNPPVIGPFDKLLVLSVLCLFQGFSLVNFSSCSFCAFPVMCISWSCLSIRQLSCDIC